MKAAIRLVAFVGVFVGMSSIGLAQEPLETGDIQSDEREFMFKLINDYGYTDLARVWAEARLKGTRKSDARAFCGYRLADCLRADGNLSGYATRIEELAREYPNYAETQGVKLSLTQAALAQVLEAVQDYLAEPDETKRAEMQKAAAARFRQEVVEPTNSAIEKLNSNKEIQENPESEDAALRDQWEHFRIRAYMLYADTLEEGNPEKKPAYEKMLEYATRFTDERYVNFVYVYEGQLFRALALAAVGQEEEAADILEVLAEVEPDASPPYPEVVVGFVRQLRLRGMEGYARTMVKIGQPEKAVALFDNMAANPSPYFPYRKEPETPANMPYRVQAEVQEAVVRMSGGDPARGFEIIDGLLARFQDEQYRLANPQAADRFIVEVSRGLSGMLDRHIGGILPEYYYRAGVGYKSRGMFVAAFGAFKLAMSAAGPSEAFQKWAALAMWEVAETQAILGRVEESALGYLGLLETFGEEAPFAARAAQNAYGYLSKLAGDDGGVWVELSKVAEGLFEQYGKGEAAEQSKLAQAFAEEEKGEFDKARKIYQSVDRTTKDEGVTKPVAFYYDAQASASRCLYFEGRSRGEEAKKAEALAELDRLLIEARGNGDMAGVSAVIATKGQLQWDDGKGDAKSASKTLSVLASEVSGRSESRRNGIFIWIQTLLKQQDIAGAQAAFDVLARDFPKSIHVTAAMLYLVDGYREAGTPGDLEKAAQLGLGYYNHPEVDKAELTVPFLCELAGWLLDGKMFKDALELLRIAEARVAELGDPDLELIVLFRKAQAAAAVGRYQEAVDSLRGLIDTRPELSSASGPEDAPDIHRELGVALLGLYSTNPKADLLNEAASRFETATAILQERIRYIRSQGGEISSEMNLEYWQSYLMYFRVLAQQKQYAQVYKQIESLRLQHGGEDFAPGALQQGFDDLQAETKGKN